MAGGIDWFRWHHGSVTDQKFPLVAKRAGASVAEVIAVWACVLEAASMNAERGALTDLPDFESMDCALGLEEGRSLAIFNAMCSRNLIDQHLQIVSWPKRQPKRERDDDTSTDRVRAFRDRERHETPRNANDNHETPAATKERSETPRVEESREEEILSSLRSESGRKRPPECPVDVDRQAWDDWTALRKAKRAPITETVIAGARAEAEKAGMTLTAFLCEWCARGSQGLKADWIRPSRSPPKSFAQSDADAKAARIAEMTGGILGKKPTIEVFDVTPTAIR